jgi:hypothetical protein
MRRLVRLLVISTLFAASFQAVADEPETQKTWKFQGKQGAVEIKLTRFVHSNGTKATSLSIYSPNGAPRSVAEEAEFLAKVLDDLPNTGINAQSLGWISFRFNEPEAVEKVAAYAASSKQWRGALKTKNMSVVYSLVTSFLNESGAYKEWASAFRSHGLDVKVAGVEKVIMEPFSKAGASCPPATNCSNLLVPTDALVQLNIVPIR